MCQGSSAERQERVKRQKLLSAMARATMDKDAKGSGIRDDVELPRHLKPLMRGESERSVRGLAESEAAENGRDPEETARAAAAARGIVDTEGTGARGGAGGPAGSRGGKPGEATDMVSPRAAGARLSRGTIASPSRAALPRSPPLSTSKSALSYSSQASRLTAIDSDDERSDAGSTMTRGRSSSAPVKPSKTPRATPGETDRFRDLPSHRRPFFGTAMGENLAKLELELPDGLKFVKPYLLLVKDPGKLDEKGERIRAAERWVCRLEATGEHSMSKSERKKFLAEAGAALAKSLATKLAGSEPLETAASYKVQFCGYDIDISNDSNGAVKLHVDLSDALNKTKMHNWIPVRVAKRSLGAFFVFAEVCNPMVTFQAHRAIKEVMVTGEGQTAKESRSVKEFLVEVLWDCTVTAQQMLDTIYLVQDRFIEKRQNGVEVSRDELLESLDVRPAIRESVALDAVPSHLTDEQRAALDDRSPSMVVDALQTQLCNCLCPILHEHYKEMDEFYWKNVKTLKARLDKNGVSGPASDWEPHLVLKIFMSVVEQQAKRPPRERVLQGAPPSCSVERFQEAVSAVLDIRNFVSHPRTPRLPPRLLLRLLREVGVIAHFVARSKVKVSDSDKTYCRDLEDVLYTTRVEVHDVCRSVEAFAERARSGSLPDGHAGFRRSSSGVSHSSTASDHTVARLSWAEATAIVGLSGDADGVQELVDDCTERLFERPPHWPESVISTGSASIYLTGRDTELRELGDAIRAARRKSLFRSGAASTAEATTSRASARSDNTLVPVIVTGLGGVGKTTSCKEHCCRARAEYEAGVFWILADSVGNLQRAIVEMAEYLNISVRSPKSQRIDVHATQTAVCRWLSHNGSAGDDSTKPRGRWLLILDNAESDALEEFQWPSCDAAGDIIVSTRVGALVQKYRAVGLTIPPLGVEDSERLLFRVAKNRFVDIETDDAVRRSIESLPSSERSALRYVAGEGTGGLPLFLEMCGKSLQKSNAKFADLEDKLRHSHREAVDDEFRALRATWAVNTANVSLDAQRLLKLLSFLAPDRVSPVLLDGAFEKLLELTVEETDAPTSGGGDASAWADPTLNKLRGLLPHSLTRDYADVTDETRAKLALAAVLGTRRVAPVPTDEELRALALARQVAAKHFFFEDQALQKFVLSAAEHDAGDADFYPSQSVDTSGDAKARAARAIEQLTDGSLVSVSGNGVCKIHRLVQKVQHVADREARSPATAHSRARALKACVLGLLSTFSEDSPATEHQDWLAHVEVVTGHCEERFSGREDVVQLTRKPSVSSSEPAAFWSTLADTTDSPYAYVLRASAKQLTAWIEKEERFLDCYSYANRLDTESVPHELLAKLNINIAKVKTQFVDLQGALRHALRAVAIELHKLVRVKVAEAGRESAVRFVAALLEVARIHLLSRSGELDCAQHTILAAESVVESLLGPGSSPKDKATEATSVDDWRRELTTLKGDIYVLEAEALEVLQNPEAYKQALQCCEAAEVEYSMPKIDDSFRRVRLLDLQAKLYFNINDNENCLKKHQECRGLKEPMFGRSHEEVARTLNGLALCYVRTGYYSQALQVAREAIDIFIDRFGHEHHETAWAYNSLAWAYQPLGRYREAIHAWKQGRVAMCEALGASNDWAMTLTCNLGNAHRSQGELDKALDLHVLALSLREDNLEPHHAQVSTSLRELAHTRMELDSVPELRIADVETGKLHVDLALDEVNRSIEIRKSEGETSYRLLCTQSVKGEILARRAVTRDDLREADELLARVHDALVKNEKVKKGHASVADALRRRGLVELKLQAMRAKSSEEPDFSAAINYFTEAIEIAMAALYSGLHHPEVARMYQLRGRAYALSQDDDRASSDYNEAMKTLEETLGPDSYFAQQAKQEGEERKPSRDSLLNPDYDPIRGN